MSYACKPVAVIRNVYTSTNVTTGAQVSLTASATHDSSEIDVFDNSGSTLQLTVAGIAKPFYIYPGGTDGRVPFVVNRGDAITIIAIDATANTGQLVINFYG